MQVNSAQDYLTQKKRQIIAATYKTIPPPLARRSNQIHLSVVANVATQRQRFIVPIAGGGAATFSSLCCLTTGAYVEPTPHGVVRYNVIPPLS